MYYNQLCHHTCFENVNVFQCDCDMRGRFEHFCLLMRGFIHEKHKGNTENRTLVSSSHSIHKTRGCTRPRHQPAPQFTSSWKPHRPKSGVNSSPSHPDNPPSSTVTQAAALPLPRLIQAKLRSLPRWHATSAVVLMYPLTI